MKHNIVKESIIETAAVLMILSGIILSFWSFYRTNDVASGVLFYLSEALVFAGSVFGIGLYFYNQFGKFASETKQDLTDFVHKNIADKGKNTDTDKK